MSRARGFLWTLNNPCELDECKLCDLIEWDAQVMNYMVFQFEIAPETGTPHVQGYTYFKSAKTITASAAWMPRAHWIVANGTHEHNRTYCTKDASRMDGDPEVVGPFEFGTFPQQGARTDLSTLREHILENNADAAALDHAEPALFNTWAKHSNFFGGFISRNAKARTQRTEVRAEDQLAVFDEFDDWYDWLFR